MAIERLAVPALHPTPGYSHVTLADGRLVFLAGQCPLDAQGVLVGDRELDRQVAQVIGNTLTALDAAGAKPTDVVRTTVYVATADRAELARVWALLTGSELGAAFSTASTLLGVSVLGYPGQLVELDVTAVLPAPGWHS